MNKIVVSLLSLYIFVPKLFAPVLKQDNNESILAARCPLCFFTCDKLYQLYMHVGSLHRECLNISCEYCSKEFKTQGRLGIHLQRIHNIDKPYSCQICQTQKNEVISFRFLTERCKHIRKHHTPKEEYHSFLLRIKKQY